MDELRTWVAAEYAKAQTAAIRALKYRRESGNPRALEHASAVARVCALGEVLRRIDHGS